MARSIKKGPFVDAHLMKKVLSANSAMIKNQLKLGQEDQLYCNKQKECSKINLKTSDEAGD